MDLRPLRRHRDFRSLFAAQLVSFLGTMATYVALPYQMFKLTGSTLQVGLISLAELLPLLVTAFVGGALADHMDRRRMILMTEAGLGLGSGVLALSALAGHPPVWLLYGEMVSYMSGPLLGNAEAGLVAKAFNVKVSVISGGALCVIGVLVCAVLLPRFVGYDARSFAHRPGMNARAPLVP